MTTNRKEQAVSMALARHPGRPEVAARVAFLVSPIGFGELRAIDALTLNGCPLPTFAMREAFQPEEVRIASAMAQFIDRVAGELASPPPVPAPSNQIQRLTEETALLREATERAAREADSRHFHEIARAGFAHIREATRRGTALQAAASAEPAQAVPSASAPAAPLPEPVAAPAAAVPVQAAVPTVGRQGLSAPQAAAVFASLTAGSWDGAGWARAFQDPGAWLAQCRVTPGKKGHKPKPSTWCPMGIACALVEGRAGRQEVVPLKTMHARFTIRPELDPWRDEWDRYFMARDAITE